MDLGSQTRPGQEKKLPLTADYVYDTCRYDLTSRLLDSGYDDFKGHGDLACIGQLQ